MADNDIINLISFDNPNIVGCRSYPDVLYCLDYDLYEVVNMKSINDIVKGFQRIVKSIMKKNDIYIMDIKSGSIENFRVIDNNAYYFDGKLYNYNYEKSKIKIKELLDKKIISQEEYKKWMKLLKPKPNISQWYKIKKEIRPNIVRWKPYEIIQGYKIHRTRKITLEEAVKSPVISKLDVIAYIDNKYVEFSIIYEFRINNKRLNQFIMNYEISLKEDVMTNNINQCYFKAIKRLYSLYYFRKEKHEEQLNKLLTILNSDLGILYTVIGDIKVLIMLLDENKGKFKRMKYIIENFIERLSIITNNKFVKNEPKILNQLKVIIRSNRKNIKPKLEKIEKILYCILNTETKKIAIEYDLI